MRSILHSRTVISATSALTLDPKASRLGRDFKFLDTLLALFGYYIVFEGLLVGYPFVLYAAFLHTLGHCRICLGHAGVDRSGFGVWIWWLNMNFDLEFGFGVGR